MRYSTDFLKMAQEAHDSIFKEEFQQVLKEAAQLADNKGNDYNELFTWTENMVHGDFSWSTLCVIKAHRVASLITMYNERHEEPIFDKIEDVILDLMNYACAWIAWRRAKTREHYSAGEEEHD